MRRLAKQDRGDRVRSAKDYQTITEIPADSYGFTRPAHPNLLVFVGTTGVYSDICLGAYIKPSHDGVVQIDFISDSDRSSEKRTLHNTWNRLALYIRKKHSGKFRIELSFLEPVAFVEIWGLTVGDSTKLKEFSKHEHGIADPHLAPESGLRPSDWTPNGVSFIGLG